MRPLLLLLLAACAGAPPPAGPDARGVLDLDGAFETRPWASDRGAMRPGPIELRAAFTLPDARVGAGSALELEGLWWRAAVTVNGVTMPPVTGGNATAIVPVGAALRPGRNELTVRLSPPTTEMPIETGGGLASSSFHRDRATLQVAPRLVLRPAAHVAWATLRAEGASVVPVAQVSGAPAGAVVDFSVVGPSGPVALGAAAVGPDGRVAAPAVAWDLERWAPGAPALYPLLARLRDPGGADLDQLSARVGVRSVSVEAGAIHINGAPHRLVGARVTNRPDLGSMPERLAALLPAGINALEIHGELPRSSWLDLADEVGLPVVVVPRCVGRTRRGSRATPAALALQQTQDDRFVADLTDRPSVLMWVGEGPSPRSQQGQATPLVMWTDHLLQDPLQRPVVQYHLPDRFLQTRPPGPDGVVHHSCEREPCKGAWLVEVTWEGPTVPAMWPAMATAFEQSIGVGAVGGVVPTPERHDVANWAAAFTPVTAAVGASPLTPDGHRAASVVTVRGAPPGETAWLSAPAAGAVGAVVAADGTATLSLWHEGAATLQVGARSQSLSLQAGTWAGLARSGGVTAVDLADR
jgi:hypothetical protein